MIGKKLDFPEDFASRESYEHFWERMLELVEQWLGCDDVYLTDINELKSLIPDYEDFMKWLSIFESDIHGFIKFHEFIRKGVAALKQM